MEAKYHTQDAKGVWQPSILDPMGDADRVEQDGPVFLAGQSAERDILKHREEAVAGYVGSENGK